MTNVKEFDLSNCTSLIELPPSIGRATNLQELEISGCSCLVKLPSIGEITNLRVFNLSNCSTLLELPSSIGYLQHLKELRLCGCLKLEALPTNINLKSLHILDLKNCTQLNRFPEISTDIEYLALDGTAIKEVPLSIMTWSRLSDFHFSYFESLKKYAHAFDIITELLVVKKDIQEVAPWVKEISRLNVLKLQGCNNLVSLPQLSDSLTYIDAEHCNSLERLDCSSNNPNIRLSFINCFKLNQEARDLIMHTSTRWYEVLPGTQVPTCFDYRATDRGYLTITLHELSLHTSLRFKASIVLEETADFDIYKYSTLALSYGMVTQSGDLVESSSVQYIGRPLTEHIYTFEVEAREVTSTKIVFNIDASNCEWKIRACGLKIWRTLHVDEHDEIFRDAYNGGWKRLT